MENSSEAYFLSQEFGNALAREGLILEKTTLYLDLLSAQKIKNTALIDLLSTFSEETKTHIHVLKDKMVKLNIRG